jgi:hypothetical protein
MFVSVCMWPSSINAKYTGCVFLKMYIWDFYKNYQAVLIDNKPDLCKTINGMFQIESQYIHISYNTFRIYLKSV